MGKLPAPRLWHSLSRSAKQALDGRESRTYHCKHGKAVPRTTTKFAMPTYEYACTACSNAWEAEQRISEPALDTCPKCGQKTAKRQISGGGAFILKGGGWYSDLYSSSGSKSGSSNATSNSTSTTSSSSASSTTSSASTPSGGSSSSSSSSLAPPLAHALCRPHATLTGAVRGRFRFP